MINIKVYFKVYHPIMSSFGFGVGDIIAISTLAINVYTAYKDAPDNYRHISHDVKPLPILINKAVEHFASTTLSDNDRQLGQEVLNGCQSVLEDLNSLIERYNSLASTNTHQFVRRFRLGGEDIATLRARLTYNTGLLNSFIQRFYIPIFTIKFIMLISLPCP